ncbi:MAG: hypothetical protein WDN76_03325 [Alphaproteobacteria bacterium]
MPWAIDAVLLWYVPARLRGRDPLKAMITLMLAGSAAFASAAMIDNSGFRYAMLLVGIPCISLVIGLYWTYPARLFRGAQAAAALAHDQLDRQSRRPVWAEPYAGGGGNGAARRQRRCLRRVFASVCWRRVR